MADELSSREREYLANLVERRHSELIHELHHAVTREYKDGLKSEIELTEQVKTKLGAG
ncbi:MAG TPA: hypothetical protein VMT89_07210 [Candidatus Acidoferrales bacterium]|nr:hypothetical protein [Candidatus Acidoferrales bacterium]